VQRLNAGPLSGRSQQVLRTYERRLQSHMHRRFDSVSVQRRGPTTSTRSFRPHDLNRITKSPGCRASR